MSIFFFTLGWENNLLEWNSVILYRLYQKKMVHAEFFFVGIHRRNNRHERFISEKVLLLKKLIIYDDNNERNSEASVKMIYMSHTLIGLCEYLCVCVCVCVCVYVFT